jgi:hypothetical protein
MAEMTRDRLTCLADDELLVYQREHHGNAYMTLAKAKEMQRVALQFWHLGAAKDKADRQAPRRGHCDPASFRPVLSRSVLALSK